VFVAGILFRCCYIDLTVSSICISLCFILYWFVICIALLWKKPHEKSLFGVLFIYRVGQKMAQCFYTPITLLDVNQFSKFFYCWNWKKICSNTINKDCTTPQVCHQWNVSVLKATIENKTISVAMHCKKLTSGNNLFQLLPLSSNKCRIFGGHMSGSISVDHAIGQCHRWLECDVWYFTR